jgi:hypothetical protein
MVLFRSANGLAENIREVRAYRKSHMKAKNVQCGRDDPSSTNAEEPTQDADTEADQHQQQSVELNSGDGQINVEDIHSRVRLLVMLFDY